MSKLGRRDGTTIAIFAPELRKEFVDFGAVSEVFREHVRWVVWAVHLGEGNLFGSDFVLYP